MSRVLVTGGAGAIGSNLVNALTSRGDDVVVLDDLSSGREDLVPVGLDLVKGSVCDMDLVQSIMRDGIVTVFHLAALFANQNSVEHPHRDLEVNGRGTLNVLEAAREAGVTKTLFCSSSCVYGPKQVMKEDDADLRPETPYAITKLLGEQYSRLWAAHHGLDVVIVRLFNCYGPGELPGPYRNVIPNFFARAMTNEPLVITGTGGETRDFTFVDDIVGGLMRAVDVASQPGEVFNLGSGVETRIEDVALSINEITGNVAGIEYRPRRFWDHVVRRRADIAKAEHSLGYRPATSLREGLERTYAWLRAV